MSAPANTRRDTAICLVCGVRYPAVRVQIGRCNDPACARRRQRIRKPVPLPGRPDAVDAPPAAPPPPPPPAPAPGRQLYPRAAHAEAADAGPLFAALALGPAELLSPVDWLEQPYASGSYYVDSCDDDAPPAERAYRFACVGCGDVSRPDGLLGTITSRSCRLCDPAIAAACYVVRPARFPDGGVGADRVADRGAW